MKRSERSRVGLVVALLAYVAAGCGGQAGQPEPPVQIVLRDYAIEAPAELAAGKHRLAIRNEGKEDHELLILPAGERDEERALLEVEEDEFPPGGTATVEVALTPGAYEFACLLPFPDNPGKLHYDQGMHVPLTVK